MNLQHEFFSLSEKYGATPSMMEKQWNDFVKYYSSSKRYYHTLTHLEQLIAELSPVQQWLTDYDTVLFAVFFHDVVYKVTRKDNEEQSAVAASRYLNSIGYPKDRMALCEQMILATKSHHDHANEDIRYFTDADLAVLGKSWDEYDVYRKNIRKEYRLYPDLLYTPGRKKVLLHFLGQAKIYKTDHFSSRYENQSRSNLQRELALLS